MSLFIDSDDPEKHGSKPVTFKLNSIYRVVFIVSVTCSSELISSLAGCVLGQENRGVFSRGSRV